MNRILLLITFSITLLTGCQSLNYIPDYNSPISKPPVGTIIQLNQALTFYPGSSRTYVQNGLAKQFNDIDERSPWCQFYRYEPPAALETMRTVEPDSFRVTSSTQSVEIVAIPAVASFASTIILPDMFERNVNERTLSTVMKIESTRQPEIVEFKCAVFNEPFQYNFVSVTQIMQTVGDVVTLKLN